MRTIRNLMAMGIITIGIYGCCEECPPQPTEPTSQESRAGQNSNGFGPSSYLRDKNGILSTRPLTPDSARIMIKAHHDNPNHIKVKCENGNQVPLIGIRVMADSLRTMLAKVDAAGNYLYKEILMMPAVRSSDLRGGVQLDQQLFTFVFVGVDYSDSVMLNDALDYCDPCPEHCPANITQLGIDFNQMCP